MKTKITLFSSIFGCYYTSTTVINAARNPISSLIPFSSKKWTVAVYMNGDNELESSITGGMHNINELRQHSSKLAIENNGGDFHDELAFLGSDANVHVVALIDRTPGYAHNMDNWTNTRLYYIEKNDFPDNNRGTYWVDDAGSDELDMSNATTLAWFIQTVASVF